MSSAVLVGVGAACLVALVAALVLVAVRSTRARSAALAAELAHARADVAALSTRVTDLAGELQETRDAAAEHEYVITSLTGGATDDRATVLETHAAAPRPPLARRLEDRLVGTLVASPARGAAERRVTELAVRAVALSHGVRRALSPQVLDRAAAEAQVARRRSRRDRRKELRDARRLLRAVKEPSRAQDVA